MKGWVAASAVAGALALGPVVYGQTFTWNSGPDSPEWSGQAIRMMTGAGSRIGVAIRDLSDDDVKAGKSAAAGVTVEDVESESPAEKAGIKSGDVVIEFDGERVRSARQFTRLVQESAPGRTVPAAVMRAGQRVAVNVQPREWSSYDAFGKLGEAKALRATPKIAQVPPAPPMPVMPKFGGFLGAGRLGITIDDLSPQLAEYFGTKDGVLVTSVNESSAAAKAGLKAGDVITSLDGGTINDAADLRRRSQRLESGDEFTLGVVRDKKPLSLKGKLEAQPRNALRSRASLAALARTGATA